MDFHATNKTQLIHSQRYPMKKNKSTQSPTNRSLLLQPPSVTWIAALIMPAVMMILIQFPLQLYFVSQGLGLLDPYSYFILLAVVCLAPSGLMLNFRKDSLHIREWHVALCLVVCLAYTPVLWVEYFYAGCIMFDDCNKL